MEQAELAVMFKALGDPTRLRIFVFLAQCSSVVAVNEQGDGSAVEGPTVGAVCCQVTGIDKITSTISFHLKELRIAGLITMEKRGKHMICSVNRGAVRELESFLRQSTAECCVARR